MPTYGCHILDGNSERENSSGGISNEVKIYVRGSIGNCGNKILYSEVNLLFI